MVFLFGCSMCLLLLQVCSYDFEIFGTSSFEQHCNVVYEELKTFCATSGFQLHMLALTRQLLGFTKSSEFPAGPLGVYLSIVMFDPFTFLFSSVPCAQSVSGHAATALPGIGSKAMTQ